MSISTRVLVALFVMSVTASAQVHPVANGAIAIGALHSIMMTAAQEKWAS